MKKIFIGDVLDADYGIIVHGCNAQSAMNSGIAGQIRKKWPKVYDDYIRHLAKFPSKKDALGSVVFTEVGDYLAVGSGITQLFYGRELNHRYVSYKAIQDVFRECFNEARGFAAVLNYPQVGAGLGGGDWSIISEIIEDLAENEFADVDTHFWVQD